MFIAILKNIYYYYYYILLAILINLIIVLNGPYYFNILKPIISMNWTNKLYLQSYSISK